MEDGQIVALYWARDERALAETAEKYGGYCYAIAYSALADREDSRECVNDTYLAAWNAMPDDRPARLAPYLGAIVRRAAIDRWRTKNAAKRGGGQLSLALEELAECVPGGEPVEARLEAQALAAVTAAAYYSDGLLDHFAGRNGGALSETQMAAIRALTAVVDQSQTVDGWTVTVDRALASRYNAYIKLDVTAPAETVLDPKRQSVDFDVAISGFNTADAPDEGVTGYGWEVQMSKEDGMAENECMILLTLDRTAAASGSDLADGATRTVTIENLRLWRPGGSDQTLAKGPWRFAFALPAAEQIELLDEAVRVPVRDPATGDRADVSVRSFRLTALGAACEYTAASDGILLFDDVAVTMADGTQVTGREKENGVRGFGKVCSFVFDMPIDLGRAVSVSFQGLKIPVSEVNENGK